jgi:peptidyl-prolyl cis-trans isomerase A (cyclophilin A)
MGLIVIELDETSAPMTSANFIKYVKDGFYEGTCFHRVVPGFVVQAGGFGADLVQKPAREPIKSEWKASVKNKRGTVAMSRLSNRHDSATSHFFVNVADNSALDSALDGAGYTVFGKVVEGMDVIDKMSKVQTAMTNGMRDVPVQPVVIEKAEWSATRPESPARDTGEVVAATKASGTVPGEKSGSSSGADPSSSVPPVDPATAAILDPTLWRAEGVEVSWAETPRHIEEISAAVRVSTRGHLGRNGARRCLIGPDEQDVPAGSYPVSVILKAGDIHFVQLALNEIKTAFVNVDLRTGSVGRRGDSVASAAVHPLGDGWYRIDIVYTVGAMQLAKARRRLLLIDDGEVGWHPNDTKSTGHVLLASPRLSAGRGR